MIHVTTPALVHADTGAAVRSLIEHFPRGATAYVELTDPGRVVSEGLESSAISSLRERPEVASFWSSRHATPLRLSLALFEGWSGLSTTQMLSALEGASVSLAWYPSGSTRARPESRRFVLAIAGPSPALQRVLGRIDRLIQSSRTTRGSTAERAGTMPIGRGLASVHRGDGVWMFTDDPELVRRRVGAAESMEREPGVVELRGWQRRPRSAWAWLAASEAERWNAAVQQTGDVYPALVQLWAQLQERARTASWLGAELGVKSETSDGGQPLRVSVRVVAPVEPSGGPAFRVRTPGSGIGAALRSRLVDAEASSSSSATPAPQSGDATSDTRDPRIGLALAIADHLQSVELVRAAGPWTELEVAATFAGESRDPSAGAAGPLSDSRVAP